MGRVGSWRGGGGTRPRPLAGWCGQRGDTLPRNTQRPGRCVEPLALSTAASHSLPLTWWLCVCVCVCRMCSGCRSARVRSLGQRARPGLRGSDPERVGAAACLPADPARCITRTLCPTLLRVVLHSSCGGDGCMCRHACHKLPSSSSSGLPSPLSQCAFPHTTAARSCCPRYAPSLPKPLRWMW